MDKDFVQENTNYAIQSDEAKLKFVNNIDVAKEITKKINEWEKILLTISDKRISINNIKSKDNARKNLYKLITTIVIIFACINCFNPIMLLNIIPLVILTILFGPLIFGTKKSNQKKIISLDNSIKLDMKKAQDLSEEVRKLRIYSNSQTTSHSEIHINPMKQPTYEHGRNNKINRIKRLVSTENNETLL